MRLPNGHGTIMESIRCWCNFSGGDFKMKGPVLDLSKKIYVYLYAYTQMCTHNVIVMMAPLNAHQFPFIDKELEVWRCKQEGKGKPKATIVECTLGSRRSSPGNVLRCSDFLILFMPQLHNRIIPLLVCQALHKGEALGTTEVFTCSLLSSS